MSKGRAPGENRQVGARARVVPGVPHRTLGRYLRRMRQEEGLTIDIAAKAIGRGAGTLHRLETGSPHVVVRDEDLMKLCELYRRRDMLPALLSLAVQGRAPSWLDEFPGRVDPAFGTYIRMEAVAERLTVYRPDMIGDLFQTPDYSRAVERKQFPTRSSEEIERRVLVRRYRQRALTREIAPAAVRLVIDEAAIRRGIGSPEVMAKQLRHLADFPAHIRVQVLPFTRGFPCGFCPGPFTILDFGVGEPAEPPVVHVESYAGDICSERVDAVRRFSSAFDVIQRHALDVPQSKRLLRHSAKEFERG